MNKLDAMIKKIEALLTQADHKNTGQAEADIFRAKAEALMFKYRIDEMALKVSGEADAPSSLAPQWADIVMCDPYSEFRHFYEGMFGAIVRHFDARHGVSYQDIEGQRMRVAHVVGYESDIRFIQMLWQSVRLEFSKRLEPKFDSSLSAEENCYNMRAAGMEGHKIAYAVFQDTSKAKRVLARKYARKHAESIGEDPKVFSGQGTNMKTYRSSYASGFYNTIHSRLYGMARARLIEESGALVLASRKEAISEMFYERYPTRRPKPAIDNASVSTIDDQSNCPKCAKAKSGYCREHGWMRPRQGRAHAYNSRAANRGSSAARNVDLGITGREIN